MSKKLAAGLEGLILDVKFGSGAWFADYNQTKNMAQTLVDVANGAGLPCCALMTDMNEILGRTAGNAIEVREAIAFLRNENIDPRLYDVTMGLCAELLALGGIAETADQGRMMAERHLEDGRAADFFDRMVHALGGPSDIIDNFDKHLPLAPHMVEVWPETPGIVRAVDTRKAGIAVIELVGGRRLATDKIDQGVGLAAVAAIGETVGRDDRPLCVMFGRDPDSLKRDEAAAAMRSLINRDSADVVVGPQFSRLAVTAAAVANAADVPMIAPMASSPVVTDGRPLVSRMAFLDAVQGEVLARLLVGFPYRASRRYPRRAHTCVWQGKSKARKKWQIKDKESMKWLNSFSRVVAIQVQHPETRLVSLGDREPDIHNLFSTRRGPRYRIPYINSTRRMSWRNSFVLQSGIDSPRPTL